MKNTDKMLQTKVEALDHLLSNPRPDDCLWSDQLLTALEQVSEYALHPGVPVKALSRSLSLHTGAPICA